MRFCLISDCCEPLQQLGLCNKHNHQLRSARRRAAGSLCGCGCGQLTEFRYVWGHHTRLFTSEEQARRGQQNTGEALLGRGSGTYYVKRNQRHEHRTVMESVLGRSLTADEIVHHKDRNKRNNNPENLELTNRREHALEHVAEMQAARRPKA